MRVLLIQFVERSFNLYSPWLQPWRDLQDLFGREGAHDGCWCMFWRLERSEFSRQKGAANRHALKSIVKSGKPVGVLAYQDGQPVAWCSVAPRETFLAPEMKRILNVPKVSGGRDVWSIVCFFVAKLYRERGIMIPMLNAVIDYARRNGAKVVEGYPIEPRGTLRPPAGCTGVAPALRKLGSSI